MNHLQRRYLWMAAIALMSVVLIVMLTSRELGKRQCARLAQAQGYLESEYIPPARTLPAQCFGVKRRNTDGTVDSKARAGIPMPD